jgi:NAD kinase
VHFFVFGKENASFHLFKNRLYNFAPKYKVVKPFHVVGVYCQKFNRTMSNTKVLFIINPISGGIDKTGFPDTVKSVLAGSGLDVHCVFSERIGHAEELSKKAVADGFDMVFSVGGDGTMNEVARGLLNTNVGLGLVPLGSGYG